MKKLNMEKYRTKLYNIELYDQYRVTFDTNI